MRWGWFGVILLCGFSPIHNEYDTKDKIKQEFTNIEQNVQGKQFTVYNTTPNLSDLQDGEVVIFSSGAVRVMFRQGQEIYSVNSSCITVRR